MNGYRIGKHTQHGLGHLLNPVDPDSEDKDWIAQAWRYLLDSDDGNHPSPPTWIDRPALSRHTVSTPDLLRAFTPYNKAKPPTEQIRPFNFILVAHLAPLGEPESHPSGPIRLIASYENDPRKWPELDWIDRHHPKDGPYTITCNPHRDETTPPNSAIVTSYRTVLTNYLHHPEHKYAAPDGAPCAVETRGLLHRHPVHIRTLREIGKEANKIDEIRSGLIGAQDTTMVYEEGDYGLENALRQLAGLPGRQLARMLRCDYTTINRIRRGQAPRRDLRTRILILADSFAHRGSSRLPVDKPVQKTVRLEPRELDRDYNLPYTTRRSLRP